VPYPAPVELTTFYMLRPIEPAQDSASRGRWEPGNCGETLLMLALPICLPRAPRLPALSHPQCACSALLSKRVNLHFRLVRSKVFRS
jgi:hypothetical protein